MAKKLVIGVALSAIFSLCSAQVKKNPDITVGELRDHLKYLASDELGGRRAGTGGANAAADYIAREFRSYGLQPAGIGGGYFQEFDFVAGVKLGKANSLLFRVQGKEKRLKLDKDFRPLGFSASRRVEGVVVFAGYGISSAEQQYDDYEGIDVKGKAVMLLRFHPEGNNQHSDFNQYASVRYKASKAKERGATALILVTGPADADNDELMRLSFDQSAGNAGMPAISITQRTADEWLGESGKALKQLQDEINSSKKPRSFQLTGIRLQMTTEVDEIREKSKNVAGLLEGSDALLKTEIVVIGAHYDHLGLGGEGSGSLRPDTVAIHNGADDNGSGTVGLLELAQFFAANRSSLRRSVAFLAFSGEELGLLGSGYFVNHPTVPLDHVITMLNMDMIGRLSEKKLIVYGTGTSSGFESLAQKYNKDSTFALKLNKDGFGPSDHSSFYGKNIPVFHFFTDLHADYHRPSDDYEKINYEGMKQVLDYICGIALELAQSEAKPKYVQVEAPRPTTGSGRGIRSYTGTIPDFGEQVEGMKISGVREGSPAAKAGLKAGDVIVKFGTIEIKNLYDYTFALSEYKPGDEVEVVLKRGSETLAVKITLERRN